MAPRMAAVLQAPGKLCSFSYVLFVFLLFNVLDVVSITVYDRDMLLNIGSSVAQCKPDFDFLNVGGLFTDTASESFVWVAQPRKRRPDAAFIIMGDFNKANFRTIAPKYFQHITINTRGDRILDHCYSPFRDAYKSLPRPPFGKSDHSSVLLLPAYRQKLKREAPALRTIQCWSDQSDATLQDCFDHVDCDMFRAASDDDIEAYSDSVTCFIRFSKGACNNSICVVLLEDVVDQIDWKKVWTLSSKYIITNKVGDISFKLLHRFYPTKMCLKRFKSDIDTSCSFCDDPNETDMHIFWDCLHTQTFWIEFSNIINRNVLQGFSLLFKDVLFGFFNIQNDKINEYFIINLLLLLAKFHIHRSKFTHQNPLFIVFKKEVQQYIQTISSSKNLKALKTVNLLHLFNLFC